MKMKKIVFLIILTSFMYNAKAQTPYYGGKGDGYASIKLKNIIFSVNSIPRNINYRIYPSILENGKPINIEFSSNIDPIEYILYNIYGETIYTTILTGSKSLDLPILTEGIYIITLKNFLFFETKKIQIVK